jgi:hypothetical protein
MGAREKVEGSHQQGVQMLQKREKGKVGKHFEAASGKASGPDVELGILGDQK